MAHGVVFGLLLLVCLSACVQYSSASHSDLDHAIAEALRVVNETGKGIDGESGKDSEDKQKASVALNVIKQCLDVLEKVNRYASKMARFAARSMIDDDLMYVLKPCKQGSSSIRTVLFDEILGCGGAVFFDDSVAIQNIAKEVRVMSEYLRQVPAELEKCRKEHGKVLCYIKYGASVTIKMVMSGMTLAKNVSALSNKEKWEKLKSMKTLKSVMEFKEVLRECLKPNLKSIIFKCKEQRQKEREDLLNSVMSSDEREDAEVDDVLELAELPFVTPKFQKLDDILILELPSAA